MLVYVNNFHLKGNSALEKALQCICGWVKYKTNEKFTLDMLRSGNDYKYGSIRVSTFCATAKAPFMYAILLSHPDNDISGRFWDTEIGIAEDDGNVKLSILLKVNDISTQVRGEIVTTRPLLVKYLLQNSLIKDETIGLKVNTLKSTSHDLRGFNFEIFRPERNYPILLVSHNRKVHIKRLQEQLIGLAQVVEISRDMDDGLMESELSRRYSAWDGAINIIYPINEADTPRNKLVLSETIDSWHSDKVNILHELLSLITHTTNGRNRKEHFSPTDVRAKRQKDQRVSLLQKISGMSEGGDYKPALDEALSELQIFQEVANEQIEHLRSNLSDTESMYYEAEASKADLENKKIMLEAQLERLQEQLNKPSTSLPALTRGSESDLYDGEIEGILIDIIRPAYNSAKQHSRRKHILKDILDSNSESQAKASMLDELKVELKDYRSLSTKLREIFSQVNIEVITDGSHNKAKFIQDERYSFSFAKSASDVNAGRNNYASIKDTFF